MPAELAPPPLYSQFQEETSVGRHDTETPGVQILIAPAADGMTFQKGCLGAEGEHAAIEGEVHLKGAQPGLWKKVTVTLRTTESACGRQIELGSSEVDLLSQMPVSETIPTSLPFAIPLMPDVPQCIHTPQSALAHVLTAALHPVDREVPIVSKDVVVHVRRYTSHTHTIQTLPETHVLTEPVRVEVEIPRSTFVVGEPIPVYITVPPPDWERVLDGSLRLRNVKAELVRIVETNSGESSHEASIPVDPDSTDEVITSLQDSSDGPSSVTCPLPEKTSDASSPVPPFSESAASHHTTVLSRSGASCRFHNTKPVRLRLILYQPLPPSSPSEQTPPPSLPSGYGCPESDFPCISITQATLLHNVSFRLQVQVSVVDINNRTERSSTLSIPIVIIPSPAPLPEVEEWLDIAYQKKHDRPPLRTVRQEDSESSVPIYQEGTAGPSYVQTGEPPPFEDRDVPPPPFFASAPSTSTRLPTFQESENEVFIAADREEHFAHALEPRIIIGEGVLFGFSASQQYDGHSDAIPQILTPPPTVEEAAQDPDVTGLVDMVQPCRVLGLILEQPDNSAGNRGLTPPPPPPLLDDPSDPPPSIDSEFRSPTTHGTVQVHSSTSIARHPFSPLHGHDDSLSQPRDLLHQTSPDTHAPPPYLTANEHEQAATPPPYMDFVHPRTH